MAMCKGNELVVNGEIKMEEYFENEKVSFGVHS